MANKIFYKSNQSMKIWEPVKFEEIKTGEFIKIVDMSPDQTEVCIEIWKAIEGYREETGVFEGDSLSKMFTPATKIIKEEFNNEFWK